MIIQLGPARDLPVMIIQLGPARDLPVMIIQQLKSQPSSTIRVGDNMCTKMQRQLLIRKLCTRIKFLGLYRIFQLHEIPPLEFGGRDCTWAPVYLAGVCSIAHRRHTGVLKCVHREESVWANYLWVAWLLHTDSCTLGVCSIAHRWHTGVLKCVHRGESVRANYLWVGWLLPTDSCTLEVDIFHYLLAFGLYTDSCTLWVCSIVHRWYIEVLESVHLESLCGPMTNALSQALHIHNSG